MSCRMLLLHHRRLYALHNGHTGCLWRSAKSCQLLRMWAFRRYLSRRICLTQVFLESRALFDLCDQIHVRGLALWRQLTENLGYMWLAILNSWHMICKCHCFCHMFMIIFYFLKIRLFLLRTIFSNSSLTGKQNLLFFLGISLVGIYIETLQKLAWP